MSLYNKASLIQVPSLYKDGTLVSTIPEDRSGDFTVARGSNLAATRVGEDGYIKKGYENILLQSNSFDTTWSVANGGAITPNHSGYDGSNDAWYLYKNTGTSSQLVRQVITSSGVQTFSFYAKAAELEWIRFLWIGGAGGRSHFHLVGDGDTGTLVNTISTSIELIGDGWYKCSTTFNENISQIQIYPASGTNSVSGSTGGVYIQDAQLNQGLVAYPYLETTTAPAQGGLLENSPRLDWSNGVPAVKLEEQRTNQISYSEYVSGPNFSIGDFISSPEGVANGVGFIPSSTNTTHYISTTASNLTIANSSVVFSFYVKEGTQPYLRGRFDENSFTKRCFFGIDLTDNSVLKSGTGSSNVEITFEDSINGWKKVIFTAIYDAPPTGNGLAIFLGSGDQMGTDIDAYAGDGSTFFHIYGLQCEQGSTPTSYIPTYGTTQTRSNEVISDNFDIPTTATIYNSFYSDTAETVFVLDQVFNVAEGLNKVAIAFSPTAVKISVGGSIVANATGTYDTTALSNIQLGSNNGTDYSNAPISGFYVFPEFLTDEELNSLTD